MRYVPPKKLKILCAMFFASGIFGIIIGLFGNILMLTFMGVLNICLGGFIGWILLTQQPGLRDKRKKKRHDDQ